MTFLYLFVALWLLKASFNILIGLVKIVLGLACSIIGTLLIGLVRCIESIELLWKVACKASQ